MVLILAIQITVLWFDPMDLVMSIYRFRIELNEIQTLYSKITC